MKVPRVTPLENGPMSKLTVALVVFTLPLLTPDEDLAKSVRTYLSALDHGAVFETTRGALGVRVTVFSDPWEVEVLTRLRDGLDRKQSPEQILAGVRADRKKLAPLGKKMGFRVDLIHDAHREKDDTDDSEVQNVHFFLSPLPKVFRFRFQGAPLKWEGWREPEGLDFRMVRVGKQHTVKNRVLVPFVSALKPKGTRAVFQGGQASFWGLLPPGLRRQKRGVLSLRIGDYDEFTGQYNHHHIVDLNEPTHHLDREQQLELSKELPLQFPRVPENLARFLERARESR